MIFYPSAARIASAAGRYRSAVIFIASLFLFCFAHAGQMPLPKRQPLLAARFAVPEPERIFGRTFLGQFSPLISGIKKPPFGFSQSLPPVPDFLSALKAAGARDIHYFILPPESVGGKPRALLSWEWDVADSPAKALFKNLAEPGAAFSMPAGEGRERAWMASDAATAEEFSDATQLTGRDRLWQGDLENFLAGDCPGAAIWANGQMLFDGLSFLYNLPIRERLADLGASPPIAVRLHLLPAGPDLGFKLQLLTATPFAVDARVAGKPGIALKGQALVQLFPAFADAVRSFPPVQKAMNHFQAVFGLNPTMGMAAAAAWSFGDEGNPSWAVALPRQGNGKREGEKLRAWGKVLFPDESVRVFPEVPPTGFPAEVELVATSSDRNAITLDAADRHSGVVRLVGWRLDLSGSMRKFVLGELTKLASEFVPPEAAKYASAALFVPQGVEDGWIGLEDGKVTVFSPQGAILPAAAALTLRLSEMRLNPVRMAAIRLRLLLDIAWQSRFYALENGKPLPLPPTLQDLSGGGDQDREYWLADSFPWLSWLFSGSNTLRDLAAGEKLDGYRYRIDDRRWLLVAEPAEPGNPPLVIDASGRLFSFNGKEWLPWDGAPLIIDSD